jgi:hypothetical protein
MARREADQARHGLDELWARVESRGWFAGAKPRVVVQVVGGACDRRLLADTVRGLSAFLRTHIGVGEPEILDLEGGGDWSPFHTLSVSPADSLTVTGIAEPLVTVPSLWFEALFLITVVSIDTDPAARLRGVLAAQAEPLRAMGWRSSRASRVYEAHRLASSDLAVACGAARGHAWWLASASDVAVDRAVAHAAGIDPATLPDLRAIARREVPPTLALVEELPGLRGVAAPAWRARLAGASDGLVSAGRFVAHDINAVRRNIGRVPHAVRRRLPALRRRAGGAK